jgi:phosphoadenosine phosphosulfate reductase
VLFPETYETWRKIEDRYGLRVEVMDATPPNGTPWSAANCCGRRKVDALERALAGTDAWITGIRREQSPTRADAEHVEWDEARGVWKFNPLVDWTDKDVWRYVHEHDLPYNALHDRGYDSIGCAPCTLPGNGREGRWAGQEKTECGLHA